MAGIRPFTVEIIMCLTAKPTSLWAASMVQVEVAAGEVMVEVMVGLRFCVNW
jgi:hypothetical protein